MFNLFFKHCLVRIIRNKHYSILFDLNLFFFCFFFCGAFVIKRLGLFMIVTHHINVLCYSLSFYFSYINKST